MRFEHQWFIVILLGTLTSVAQQPATGKTSDAVTDKPAASGVISGHVYLSDTKGPARGARMTRVAVSLSLSHQLNRRVDA